MGADDALPDIWGTEEAVVVVGEADLGQGVAERRDAKHAVVGTPRMARMYLFCRISRVRIMASAPLKGECRSDDDGVIPDLDAELVAASED